MDDNERLIQIEDLKKAKELLLEQIKDLEPNWPDNEVKYEDSALSQEKQPVKSFGSSITGGLNMYPDYEEKAGKSNIILLSILSFIFEVLFLLLAFYIYTK